MRRRKLKDVRVSRNLLSHRRQAFLLSDLESAHRVLEPVKRVGVFAQVRSRGRRQGVLWDRHAQSRRIEAGYGLVAAQDDVSRVEGWRR